MCSQLLWKLFATRYTLALLAYSQYATFFTSKKQTDTAKINVTMTMQTPNLVGKKHTVWHISHVSLFTITTNQTECTKLKPLWHQLAQPEPINIQSTPDYKAHCLLGAPHSVENTVK